MLTLWEIVTERHNPSPMTAFDVVSMVSRRDLQCTNHARAGVLLRVGHCTGSGCDQEYALERRPTLHYASHLCYITTVCRFTGR